MKKVLILFVLCIFAISNLQSQSAMDNVNKYYKDKDFNKASAFISQAVSENRKDFDFMILAGDIFFELEKNDSALIMYLKADEISGDKTFVLRKIANTYSKLKNVKNALEYAHDAIKEDNKDEKNYLCLGHIYLEADSIKQAELFITKAREINKKSPDAFIALGDLYFAQRVYELAKNNYEEALSLDENNIEARTQLAISYYWLANREYDEDLANELFKKSLKEWNTITKQDTMNARAFYEQGKILFWSKRYADAAPSLYRYVQLRPSGSLGRWFLAQSLYEMALCDSAEPHLKICANEIDTVTQKAKLMLARCYFDAKKYQNAISAYEMIINDLTLEVEDMKRYAGANFLSGDTLKALSVYEKIIAKDSVECKLTFQTAVMFFQLKRYDDAIRVFSANYKGCNENLSKNYFYIGNSYLNKNVPDSAIAPFKKSYEIDSSNIRALIYVADAFAKINKNDSAIYYFDVVIAKAEVDTVKYKQELSISYQKLCGIYLNEKKAVPLKKVSQQWVTYYPENPTAYLYLGASFQLAADTENACKNYRMVLKFDKENKFAKDMLGKLSCP